MKQIMILLLLVVLMFAVGCANMPERIDVEATEEEHGEGEHGGEHGEDHGNFSVEIKCEQLKKMPISEIAALWGIDSEELLDGIIFEYDLKGIYTTKSTLDDLRAENKFQPRGVKVIAESIKGPAVAGEEVVEKTVSDCPFEEVNDPYPGKCGAYTDKDDDGFCDHSQS